MKKTLRTAAKFCASALFSAALIGCATGHCRKGAEAQVPQGPQPAKPISKSEIQTVRVYKYDGTLQCAQGRETPPEQMKNELQGLTVYSSEKLNDGLIRIQVCGEATGRANVYEIPKSELPLATARGFKEWKFR